jgi:hypothetical protein
MPRIRRMRNEWRAGCVRSGRRQRPCHLLATSESALSTFPSARTNGVSRNSTIRTIRTSRLINHHDRHHMSATVR